MSMEMFLKFIFSHNTMIIEVLIAVTALAGLFLAFRSFAAGEQGPADLGKLEETLKKILEKANTVTVQGASGASVVGGSDNGALLSEISTLKAELEDKKKMVDEIQKQSGDPKGAKISSEEKAALEAKIKELEGKLSEYEIISEDIADLSKYKEQNQKLQQEIEQLKKSGAQSSASAQTPAAQSEPAAAASTQTTTSSQVAASAAPPAASPTAPPAAQASPATQSSAAAEASVNNVVDDDIMKEFSAAVEKQKEMTGAQAAGSSQDVDLGSMDVDKMMAEAENIQVPDKEISFDEAVGTGLNEDKLLAEASALEPGTKEDQKLLGQFENFVKKSDT